MKSLIFESVTFGYQKNQAIFDNLSCNFQNPHADKGHIIALMGASGSGKSTLLKLILNSIKPQKGIISTFPSKPIISYLPQEAVLFEHLNCLQNATYFKNTAAYSQYFDNMLFEQLSSTLGMTKILKESKSVNELSGGQKQRLSLLRALSIKPDILLLDEPTNGLDADVKLQFLHELRRIVLQQKMLAIYVTHHKLETELIVDEIAYLYNTQDKSGNILYQNDLLNFLQKPPILEAVKVFNYPKPNILQCISVNGHLTPNSDTFQDFFYISLKSENIHFSDTIGHSFTIISANPVFTLIMVENNQYLTIDTPIEGINQNQKIYFHGLVCQYDKKNTFLNFLSLKYNKIN